MPPTSPAPRVNRRKDSLGASVFYPHSTRPRPPQPPSPASPANASRRTSYHSAAPYPPPTSSVGQATLSGARHDAAAATLQPPSTSLLLQSENGSPFELNMTTSYDTATEYPFPPCSAGTPTLNQTHLTSPTANLSGLFRNWSLTTPPNPSRALSRTFGSVSTASGTSSAQILSPISPTDHPLPLIFEDGHVQEHEQRHGQHQTPGSASGPSIASFEHATISPHDILPATTPPKKTSRRENAHPPFTNPNVLFNSPSLLNSQLKQGARAGAGPAGTILPTVTSLATTIQVAASLASPSAVPLESRLPGPIPFRQPSWSDSRRASVTALTPASGHARLGSPAAPEHSSLFPTAIPSPFALAAQAQPLPARRHPPNLSLRALGIDLGPPTDLFSPDYSLSAVNTAQVPQRPRSPPPPESPAPNLLRLDLGEAAYRFPAPVSDYPPPQAHQYHPAPNDPSLGYQTSHVPEPTARSYDSPLPISHQPTLPHLHPSEAAQRWLHGHRLDPEFEARYTLFEELGSGGFGFVYSAFQTGIGNVPNVEVAVKFIIKHRLAIAREALVEGEPVESYILRRLRHPNIIQYIELFEDERFYYMVQELHGDPWERARTLEGANGHHAYAPDAESALTPSALLDLTQCASSSVTTISPTSLVSSSSRGSFQDFASPMRPHLGRRASHDLFEAVEHNRFSEEQTKWIFKQIVDGVAYLHHHGVYHRDLKDENIVLDRHLNVKIIDFGSAVMENPMMPPLAYHRFRGTNAYASPEVLRGDLHHAAPCDIWALGIILAILLTGESPFPDRSFAEYGYMRLRREVSPSAMDLLRACLEPDPQRRAAIGTVGGHAWLAGVGAGRVGGERTQSV